MPALVSDNCPLTATPYFRMEVARRPVAALRSNIVVKAPTPADLAGRILITSTPPSLMLDTAGICPVSSKRMYEHSP